MHSSHHITLRIHMNLLLEPRVNVPDEQRRTPLSHRLDEYLQCNIKILTLCFSSLSTDGATDSHPQALPFAP